MESKERYIEYTLYDKLHYRRFDDKLELKQELIKLFDIKDDFIIYDIDNDFDIDYSFITTIAYEQKQYDITIYYLKSKQNFMLVEFYVEMVE